jgi:hypothetical protein
MYGYNFCWILRNDIGSGSVFELLIRHPSGPYIDRATTINAVCFDRCSTCHGNAFAGSDGDITALA